MYSFWRSNAEHFNVCESDHHRLAALLPYTRVQVNPRSDLFGWHHLPLPSGSSYVLHHNLAKDDTLSHNNFSPAASPDMVLGAIHGSIGNDDGSFNIISGIGFAKSASNIS
jgi:hypothetical protein